MTNTMIEPETDPYEGRGIPREDHETLNNAQLRAKYPKAFEFEDRMEAEFAVDKKKEDAKKATFEQMFHGDVKRIRARNGVLYIVRPTTLRLQILLARTLDRYMERGQSMESMLLMQIEQVKLVLDCEDASGVRTPATEEQVLDAFLSEELDSLLKISRGEETDISEGEDSPNPL